MVPHATEGLEQRRRSSSINPAPQKFKFPDFHQESAIIDDGEDISRGPSPRPLPNGLPPGLHSSERWPAAKRESNRSSLAGWAANGFVGKTRHGRQKSLSEAIHTIRTRGRTASISENAHEIAESLKAPVSFKLVLLCAFWYSTSILTNTSSKAILTALPKPVTLTIIQFALVSFWCIFLSWLAKRNATIRNAAPVLKNGIRKPNKDIIMATLPLTAFQIGGHILNSDAMSKIPVSLVHTIKGLSPLMTVLAYRLFLNVKYSAPTYLSLIPLTLGVILACSASFKANFLGLLNAFGSAILFVTQNIVSKKIFTDSARAEADGVPIGRRKPDKLNLLCYSSLMALGFTFPIWLWSEGFALMADFYHDASIDLRVRPGSLDHGRLTLEFLFNGTFHFGQSLVAFVLLGMTSPVTYSVASLIKRVVVIMFAIVWFGNPMTGVQGFGFLLTFLGLYLYDRTSDAEKQDRKVREREAAKDHLLPLNLRDAKKNDAGPGAAFTQSPMSMEDRSPRHSFGGMNGYANGDAGSGPGRPHNPSPNANGVPISLPLGTKAAETWNHGDVARQQAASTVR
ncbi:putative transporter C83.11 [Pseudocercospora fuligena]|uniref:Putative transporter C83.11 n=1 Tax=Pseudocercospora fuligena TaxID=685502 RepID=A0A8H6RT09_9PEZI|nr:putative transporter C83.11 [Pseudocercospora fuligena]